MRLIEIFEGTSSVGKTSIADISLDFQQYIDNFSEFKKKNDFNFIQSLYENRLYADIIRHCLDFFESVNKSVSFDRFSFSQIIYGLLHYCNGTTSNTEDFKRQIDELITPSIADQFRKINTEFINTIIRMGRLCGKEVRVKIYWCVAQDVDFTIRAITKRGTFETSDGTDLKNYIENQNYIFSKFHQILQCDTADSWESVYFPCYFVSDRYLTKQITQ